MQLPEPLENLIHQFAKLPGVGKKSAMRMVFHILSENVQYPQDLVQALNDVSEKIKPCSECFSYTDQDVCEICNSPRRNTQLICVVEKQSDLLAFERSGEYQGLYHVLGAAISPLDGIGPADIHIPELLMRIRENEVTEVILATSSSAEGESTAHFIDKSISNSSVRRTRLARGIPMGTELEYLDDHTLSRALQSRIEL